MKGLMNLGKGCLVVANYDVEVAAATVDDADNMMNDAGMMND